MARQWPSISTTHFCSLKLWAATAAVTGPSMIAARHKLLLTSYNSNKWVAANPQVSQHPVGHRLAEQECTASKQKYVAASSQVSQHSVGHRLAEQECTLHLRKNMLQLVLKSHNIQLVIDLLSKKVLYLTNNGLQQILKSHNSQLVIDLLSRKVLYQRTICSTISSLTTVSRS